MNEFRKTGNQRRNQRLIAIKKILGYLSLFFFIFPTSRAMLLEIDLNDALNLALKQNFDIQSKRIELTNKGSEIIKAKTEFIPRFELEYSYLRQEAQPKDTEFARETSEYKASLQQKFPLGGTLSLSYFSGMESISEINSDIHLGDDDLYSDFTVLFTQPLLRGGLAAPFFADIRKAKLDFQIQENVLNEFHINLINQVKTAFYHVLKSQELIAIDKKALEISEKVLKITRSRSKLGISPQIDSMTAEIEKNKSKETLLVSHQALESAKKDLQNLLGIEDSIVAVNNLNEEMPVIELDDAIAISFEKNKKLIQIKAQLAKQQLDVQVAKNEVLPQLDLFASYGKIKTAFDSYGYNDEYRAGITISYPLYNKGLAENLRQNKRELKKLEIQYKMIETEIVNTLNMLIKQINRSDERIKILKMQIEIVNNQIEIVLKAFDDGLIGLSRVYDARNDFSQEERRYLDALLERSSKWFAVQTIMGVDNRKILP